MQQNTEERGLENIDPRLLGKFLRDPSFIQRTSPEQVTSMQRFMVTSKWTRSERKVYEAVLGGCTDVASIEQSTGLSESAIESVVESLVKKGYLKTTLEPVGEV